MDSKRESAQSFDQLDSSVPEPKHDVPENAQPKKHKLAAGFLIAGAVLIICIFLFFHQPDIYKPAEPENRQEVSPYLTHHLAPDFNYNIQLDEPFIMVVQEEGLNDIIARGYWPQTFGAISISAPAAVFTQGMILGMAKVNFSSVPTVVSVQFAPMLSDDGLLTLNLQYVKMGSVRITAFAKTIARGILAQQQKKYQLDDWVLRLWEGILDNKPFVPVFPAYDKKIRLTKADIQTGQTTLTFEPELKQ